MSFFERARAGYDNLAGRTDDAFDRATASKDLGEIDKHYRDLGVLAYLAATGRPADQATQQRLLGALTALEQRGHDLSGLLWSARLLREAPSELVAAHRDFVDAGADVVITASYQVGRFVGAYGTAISACGRAGHVSSSATASFASSSLSANTGEASTMPGVSRPELGIDREATICSSTRRSTSALMRRAHA